MVKVIATDLDGTLLKPKRKFTLVEKENRKFIKNFYGDIVLNSGRQAKFCAKICNNLKIDHNFIALNGAIIVKMVKLYIDNP
jgi:hydroxymethylpyrimidine pyrophosphatase-like HAD family hydrolase